ncbi:MAG: transporter [Caulobacter sp.]|nr:transporter [Caulobacter sp.]
MRLLGHSIILIAALNAAAASAQTAEPPTASAVRLAPTDGRLQPLLASPGARQAFRAGDDDNAPGFELRWRGEDSDWNLSAASRLVEESRANAADFQTPGLFETEAALVRKVGDFRIGAAGYSARQVGDKGKQAPKLGPMRWQGSAVGPVVGYDTRIGGKPATVSLRWYREIDAPGENGDTISAAFTLRF